MTYNTTNDIDRQRKIDELQKRLGSISGVLRKDVPIKNQALEDTWSQRSLASHEKPDTQSSYQKAKESTPSVEEILQDIKQKIGKNQSEPTTHFQTKQEDTNYDSAPEPQIWKLSNEASFVTRQNTPQTVIKSRDLWKPISRDRLNYLKKKTLSRILFSKNND